MLKCNKWEFLANLQDIVDRNFLVMKLKKKSLLIRLWYKFCCSDLNLSILHYLNEVMMVGSFCTNHFKIYKWNWDCRRGTYTMHSKELVLEWSEGEGEEEGVLNFLCLGHSFGICIFYNQLNQQTLIAYTGLRWDSFT